MLCLCRYKPRSWPSQPDLATSFSASRSSCSYCLSWSGMTGKAKAGNRRVASLPGSAQPAYPDAWPLSIIALVSAPERQVYVELAAVCVLPCHTPYICPHDLQFGLEVSPTGYRSCTATNQTSVKNKTHDSTFRKDQTSSHQSSCGTSTVQGQQTCAAQAGMTPEGGSVSCLWVPPVLGREAQPWGKDSAAGRVGDVHMSHNYVRGRLHFCMRSQAQSKFYSS